MDLVWRLSKSPGCEVRHELLRQVASLFLLAERDGFKDAQIDLFGEVMCGLLKQAAEQERVDLSSRIAESPKRIARARDCRGYGRSRCRCPISGALSTLSAPKKRKGRRASSRSWQKRGISERID